MTLDNVDKALDSGKTILQTYSTVAFVVTEYIEATIVLSVLFGKESHNETDAVAICVTDWPEWSCCFADSSGSRFILR